MSLLIFYEKKLRVLGQKLWLLLKSTYIPLKKFPKKSKALACNNDEQENNWRILRDIELREHGGSLAI